MADLVPAPLGALCARLHSELSRGGPIFDLPARRFARAPEGLDLSVALHGRPCATPAGPAAGPHTQLAQNLVLGFLAGARIFELKTVQANDRLKIPRPCIDMRGPGYNVEWSQELSLEESLVEYVKGSMLIELLAGSGELGLPESFTRFAFDLSAGYDLAGLTSERVRTFLSGMRDARPIVDRLRREIPAAFGAARDLDFATGVARSVTLSTFHGCPPEQIEEMAGFLMEAYRFHVIVKLNPTLLGAGETRRIVHDVLGYADRVPEEVFAGDPGLGQAIDLTGRLSEKAASLGLSFGVKLTNTLVVENRGDFLPRGESRAYLSGPPLHVLAMQLVARFREAFGGTLPISFSGGVDRKNFPDAVAAGLVPVTACSDLLRPGGYGRMAGYLAELAARMQAAGARTIDAFVAATHRAAGGAPGASLAQARVENSRRYAARVLEEPRFASAAHAKPPRKVGRALEGFDCLSCDLCVPACPNDANFAFALPEGEIPIVLLRQERGGWQRRAAGSLRIAGARQFGNFADFCNDCGNCDVFCPEDGGPYVVKPRFYGSYAAFLHAKPRDGFHLERREGIDVVDARFGGRDFVLTVTEDGAIFAGDGFHLVFLAGDLDLPAQGVAGPEVDLTYFRLMDALRRSLLDGPGMNPVRAGAG